jgi:16S rRNA (guanine966-N2)-methyltransferase
MALKILQGQAKDLSLVAPSSGTRPTSVLLRRKIFDAHQDMSDSVFIDCCAGTGAMGLEAASRGASKVVLIEASRQAFSTLKKNSANLQKRMPEAYIELHAQTCQKWLEKNLEHWNSSQTIIFLDPPYEHKQTYFDVIRLFKECGRSGQLWLESDRQKGLLLPELEAPEVLGAAKRVYKQGTSFIALWSFG